MTPWLHVLRDVTCTRALSRLTGAQLQVWAAAAFWSPLSALLSLLSSPLSTLANYKHSDSAFLMASNNSRKSKCMLALLPSNHLLHLSEFWCDIWNNFIHNQSISNLDYSYSINCHRHNVYIIAIQRYPSLQFKLNC